MLRAFYGVWLARQEWAGYVRELWRNYPPCPPPPHIHANIRLNFLLALERRARATRRANLLRLARTWRQTWDMEDNDA